MHKFLFFLMSCFCIATDILAQTSPSVANQNPGAMEANGKIYVVMIICLVILVGLIGYLVTLDRRLQKLEQPKK